MISVVIATHQRPEQIRQTLAHFTGVDFPAGQYEIIVVDDGSQPPLSPSGLQSPPNVSVTVMRVEHGGPGAARNAGAAHARGELIAFTADDCQPERDWLQTLAAAHAQYPDCAIGGEIVHALPANPYSTTAALLIQYMRRRFNSDPLHATFFTPNNLAVPARQFLAVGGFDPQFGPAGEDRDFCSRWIEAGHRMVSVPFARVRHCHPLTLSSFLRMQFQHGRGSMLYRRARRRRTGERVRLEEASFYAGLFLFPLTEPGRYGLQHIALLAVSQFAVAAGALRGLFPGR